MGKNLDLFSFAVLTFAGYLLQFVIVPLLAAAFIYQGFKKYKVDATYRQCNQACFFAASAAIVVGFGLSFALSGRESSVDLRQVFRLICVGVQLLVVPLLLRQRSRRALLIEFGGIVLANIFAYGIFTFLASALGQG